MSDESRLILASRSPRRAELLLRLGLTFEVVPAEIDESYTAGEAHPQHAERLAREKALAIAARFAGATVLGSDTIVVLDGEVLGKPVSTGDAVRMLGRLSGRVHQVFTGVAVARRGAVASAVERVEVRFRELTPREREEYAATGEPLDKAGAYGIQGFGSALVESISGDYFAVMGLPIVRTLALLRSAGWRYAFAAGLLPDEGGPPGCAR
jgi:septum formation protein